jgi:competence protein ComEC
MSKRSKIGVLIMRQSLALAWLIGIALMGQKISFLPTFGFALAMLFFLLLLLQLYIQTQLQQPRLRLLNLSLGVVFSFILGYSYAQSALQDRLALRETKILPTQVIVYVNRINQPSERSIAQQVKVLNFKTKPVNWLTYTAINEKNQHPKTEILKLGQYYRLSGEIRPAHAYATLGAFDQEQWYLQQNIMASLRIQHVEALSAHEIKQLGLQHHIGFWQKLHLSIEKKRLQVREFIVAQPLTHQGLLLGLLTGDRSLLQADTEDEFRRFGISHLLAISGPHVLIFAAMMCFALHRLIRSYWPHIYLKWPKNYILILPFLSCVALYCACVGFEIPALRTLLIASLSCVFLLFKYALKPLSLLLYSAALLLLFDPFSVLSAAFWLSYGACFILLRIYQTIQASDQLTFTAWQRAQQAIKLLVESQWKIFVALLPLMLIFFKQVAWISPLSNLIAIPFLGLLVVPLDIMAGVAWLLFEPLGLLLWQINDHLLGILLGILQLLDLWFKPNLLPWAMNIWQLLALILALVLLFLPRGLIPKAWAVLCLLPVFFYDQSHDPFELHILDVGQGQAVLIRDQGNSLMVDVGGSPDESRFSLGENVILPFLMRNGIQHLDQVLLTHLDQDHSGAYLPLSQKLKIKTVMSNERPEGQTTSFEYCHRGQKWQWKRVQFEVLSPPETALAQASQAKNETSCVLYVTYQGQQKNTHFLLMGDAGWRTEHQILLHYPHLKVDVLLLGHHGSKHSSAYGFLQHYQPKIAVASAGFANRYGHPTNEVKARLNALNIAVLTTIEQGSMRFSFDQNEQMLLQSQRQQRLWLQREDFQFGSAPQPLAHYINRPKQDWP